MRISILVWGISLFAWGQTISPQDAQQAFDSHQFQKALSLWTQLYKQNPHQFSYGLKTAELKFLLEGRKAALSLLSKIEENKEPLPPIEKQVLEKKKKEFLESFLSEEAQTYFLQADSKMQLKEWATALSLIQQANSVEPFHGQILQAKLAAERQMGLYSELLATLEALKSLDYDNSKFQDDGIEAEIALGEFDNVIKKLENSKKLSFRGKLALLEAYLKTNENEKAKELFDSFQVENSRLLSQSIEFQWLAFEFYSSQKQFQKQASQTQKRLLALLEKQDGNNTSQWNPYRINSQSEILAK